MIYEKRFDWKPWSKVPIKYTYIPFTLHPVLEAASGTQKMDPKYIPEYLLPANCTSNPHPPIPKLGIDSLSKLGLKQSWASWGFQEPFQVQAAATLRRSPGRKHFLRIPSLHPSCPSLINSLFNRTIQVDQRKGLNFTNTWWIFFDFFFVHIPIDASISVHPENSESLRRRELILISESSNPNMHPPPFKFFQTQHLSSWFVPEHIMSESTHRACARVIDRRPSVMGYSSSVEKPPVLARM